jgi:hypothetical protein
LPVQLVFGDADAVRPAHAVQFFELLGGGKQDNGWAGIGLVARTARHFAGRDPLQHSRRASVAPDGGLVLGCTDAR